MKDSPIVGVLEAATRDHLLIDVPLHITLCGNNPKGKVLCEAWENISVYDVLEFWNQSTRQCSRCAKKIAKREREEK